MFSLTESLLRVDQRADTSNRRLILPGCSCIRENIEAGYFMAASSGLIINYFRASRPWNLFIRNFTMDSVVCAVTK
ncbi:hypothetical protein PUN28_007311 [Cardiocondyla obscurior]|uniref:Uncharacterized protein n=1 Tax=Cardiocondyla obscurior TaxID=286306 RepID=A0AAW2G7L2_9HYME